MIYIFGSSGMLGGYLKEQFPEATCFERKDYDLSCITKEDLRFLRAGDVVINAAGVIPQSVRSDYHLVNSVFPMLLGDVCCEAGARLIHVSTDCIYSGKKGSYVESDPGDSEEPYGLSKIEGEKTKGTVVATSIIGEERRNKASLLEWVKSRNGGIIHGFNNHIWNGLTCWQLSKVIREIIDKNLFWEGKRYVFSPEPVTKYELIKIICSVYSLDINVILVDEYAPKNMTLSSEHPRLFDIPPIEQQVLEQFEVGKHIF